MRSDATGGERPRLAAVVVNYRTPAETSRAVASLQASRRAVQEIVVVDNGSGDGSESELRRRHPGVLIVQTGTNRGFAGGTNAGIAEGLRRGAALLFLLNSDAEVTADCVERLEAALDAVGGSGIAGPLVLSRADPARAVSRGIRYSPASGRMYEEGAGRDHRELPGGRGPRPVDAVSGCAMLIRRAALERTGLLAEEYFFSFEDLDLCLRARRAGFVTLLVDEAIAHHEGSRTVGRRSPRRVYFATRNHLLLARRAGPARHPLLGALRAATIVALNVGHVLAGGEVPRLAGLVHVALGVRDHLRGRYGDGP